jgi:hypothetical protein
MWFRYLILCITLFPPPCVVVIVMCPPFMLSKLILPHLSHFACWCK